MRFPVMLFTALVLPALAWAQSGPQPAFDNRGSQLPVQIVQERASPAFRQVDANR